MAEEDDNPLFRGGADDSEESDYDLPRLPTPTPPPEPPPQPKRTPRKDKKAATAPPPPPPPPPVDPVALSNSSDLSDEADSLSDDEDDDPVVRSYDVYITTGLEQSLYLFQYPVRDAAKPYTLANNTLPKAARFKPKSGMVEVDIPINFHQNYDEEKGRQWGDLLRRSTAAKEAGVVAKGGRKKAKVQEPEEIEDPMYVSFEEAARTDRILKHQTLGTKIQPEGTNYMIGVFTNDDIHMTRVQSTVQLRPQFPHVDAQLAADRALAKARRDEEAPPEAAKRINTTVKNPDDPANQLTSNQKATRLEESESWTHLDWVDQEHDLSWEQYALLSKGADNAELRAVTKRVDYLDWLSGQMWRRPLPDELREK